VKLYETVISDRNGCIKFYQSGGGRKEKEFNPENESGFRPEGWDYSGSIRQPKVHSIIAPWITFEETTVKSVTLDTWCNEDGVKNIDFIWMDVQGAEIDVFRGGENILARTRFIYTEYGNLEYYKGQYNLKRLLRYLRDFEIVIRCPGDVLLRNKRYL
jgi:FkbM family methyltransferase